MLRDLSFKDVCEFIKADDPSFIPAADKLFGLGLILSPLALGLPPEATVSVLGLIEVKNELIRLGKDLFEKVTRRKDEDNLAKQERMRIAYGLICYTAFFEAVDQVMPEIKEPLGLQPEEKFLLSKEAILRAQAKSNTECSLDETIELLKDWKVVFPHPVDSLEQQNAQLPMLYEELSKGFMSFLQGLTVWESASHETKESISRAARLQLPRVALDCFEAQYYQLAAKFPDFLVWSNLQEHKKTQAQTDLLSGAMSDFHKQYDSLMKNTNKATIKAIDQGFLKLTQLIEAIPSQIEQFKANRILEELRNHYKSVIEQPIIKPYEAGEGAATLTFPKKSQTFIPQSFKVIRCTTGKERLEHEVTWTNVKSRNDLGAFLISYLTSPYSTAVPLIILGHPGSGKSLLTQILSAKLWSSLHIPIRVELRDINAENEIPAQIHDQICKDIDRNVRWTDLTDNLSECTPIVILDGYDELLQASGKVFSGYLRKVQEFQEQQAGIRKPVVTIVTSRITLIDKADIPLGATVIRLEEFDEARRKKWISFWNKTNQQYFKQAGIEPFELPAPANQKIIPLAEQPLLLLMLALYDSDGNQLRNSTGLDQTLLYDNLIRRFIRREKQKDKFFREQEEWKREVEVDQDMERLGVAAVSMFNQRSLYIRSGQLDKALAFFKLERFIQDSSGRALSQAELLLGSFFFVHQSKSAQKSENPQERKLETAFEFLHNTFGEFLTAEFILRQVLNETNALHDLKQNPRLKSTLTQMLESPDGFSEPWFVSLIYTPLYSRPVILDMMREWLKHKLVASENNYETFLKDFDTIIANQINRLLTNKNLPSIMTGGKETCFQELPLVGYISIYSLNLILLRTILSPEGYTFDEENISPHEDGTRVWDQLTYLWRSWFSLDNLNGLTAILAASREGNKIFIKAKESFSLPSFSDRLDSLLAVSITLADNMVAGVAGLIRHSSLTERNALPLSEVQNRLESENIDLSLKILVERLKCEFRRPLWQGGYGREQEILATTIRSLHISRWSEPEDIADLIRLFRESENLHFNDQFLEILLHEMPQFEHFSYGHLSLWLETAKLLRNSSNFLFSDYFVERFFSRIPISLFKSLRPELTLEIIQIAREVSDQKIFERLSEVFLEHFDPRYLEEISPNGAVEVMRLAREIGDARIFNPLSEVFFKRLHPRDLEKISPDGAVELIRLIAKIGDQRILDQLLETFLERLDSRYLKEMSPETMVELMHLAQEINNQKLLRGVSEAFIKWLHPRDLVRLSPDVMIELMRSTREIGNQEFIRRISDVFIELHPRYYLRLSPKTVIELIKLSKELNDPKIFKQMVQAFFEQIQFNNIKKIDFEAIRNFIAWLRLNVTEGNKKRFYTQSLCLFNFSECPLNLEIEILFLANELNDKKLLNLVFNTSSQEISDGESIEGKKLLEFRQELFENIGNLPLNTLKNIRRLAQKFSDEQLVIEIDRQLHPDSN